MLPPIKKVATLGGHMPLEARRIVSWCGKSTLADTVIGELAGLADGAIVVRVKNTSTILHEMTPAEAKAVAEALHHAAYGVENWSEHASGFDRVRVARSAAGEVDITYRGETHRMRACKTRVGARLRHYCQVCKAGYTESEGRVFYVLADRGPAWNRTEFCEVCAACVDRLANAPEHIAEVMSISPDNATGRATTREAT